MQAKQKVNLTDKGVKALKAADAGTRRVIWDGGQPGLALRITDKGRKTFTVVARKKGDPKPIWYALGEYDDRPGIGLKLGEARKAAQDALRAFAAGKHPNEVEEERRREEARRRQDTFGVVADDFIKRHLSKLRSGTETEALIRHKVLGQEKVEGEWVADTSVKDSWRDRPITSIARRDVVELIERVIDNPGPYQARKTLAHVRKLFNWAIQRGTYGLEHSPCAYINVASVIGAPSARTRVLADNELRIIWEAAGKLGNPFGPFIKTLMLTGQRLNEIAAARWAEIDAEVTMLTVPAERMKGKIAHAVPVTPMVKTTLDELPRFERSKEKPEVGVFVFTTTSGVRPISGFSKFRVRLDKEISKVVAEARKRGEGIDDLKPWVVHDLRRTVRTRLSSLGVLPLVAELVIGHKQQGIHAVYDLHRYDDEKRAALQKWEDYLLGVVGPKEPEKKAAQAEAASNVVAMRKRARK